MGKSLSLDIRERVVSLVEIEATPDKTMPELAAELFKEHRIRATPAMLSRHLIHRLGYTYKKP